MALRPVPRRAILAAFLGFLYGMLILPAPQGGPFALGAFYLFGLVWVLLSFGLLALLPMSYHVFSTWAILWVVYRGTQFWQTPVVLVIDVLLPIASAALLLTSQYLPVARAWKERG